MSAWLALARMAAALAGVLLALTSPTHAAPAPDVTLRGVMTGADHETYREVPFRVPAGVVRITVEFEYAGKDDKSVIDLGLRDPQRFRGWSGGNKTRFTLSEAEATPSYLPGPLPAGTWRLVLGAPNIRKASKAPYTARIWFDRTARFAGFAEPATGAGWYRGDLHTHTGHSDGVCPSAAGVRAPCPVFRTLQAAAERGLDFVAVTDHNTTSQAASLRELASHFDNLVVIPGREITTFKGHANAFGPLGPIDFQLGSPRAPSMAAVQRQVAAAGGLFSINHPGLPSGELCMGCGWTVADTDFQAVDAVEVVNGGALAYPGGAESPLSGIPFWEAQLNAGRRITAIGGSDNHDAALDPAKPGAVGYPTTVVKAQARSQDAILAGVRAGHVFIDVTGSKDRLLEVVATAGGARAEMGDALPASAQGDVTIVVRVAGAEGGVISPAGPAATSIAPGPRSLTTSDQTLTLSLPSTGRRGWLRIDVRGPGGELWLLGNPVYFGLD